MKKFIAIMLAIAVAFFILDSAYYRLGWYIDLHPQQPVTTFVKTEGDRIYLDSGSGYEPFEIRGVNMGSGMPGKWATEFGIDKETYLRWFRYIKEMGANTIRVYTIQQDVFYNAFYEYNKDNPDPLYLIHGVWVNDYVQNSHRDAYSRDFYDTFLSDCKTMLDVIHGNKKLSVGSVKSAGHGTYLKDISPWVIGYILGVEWEDITVAYTDDTYREQEGYSSYRGKYLFTAEEASPFETLLCRVGDKVIEYETARYKTQKLVAFSNWPTTDPFEYPDTVKKLFMKYAYVDVENIKTTPAFLSGQFASYHVYPYYSDYLNWTDDWASLGITDKTAFVDEQGNLNTYKAYLSLLTAHHTMPVVISEFGVSSGRGMAHRDMNTGRNQGNMSEQEQGQALVRCYEDIKSVGCAGCCIFSWQDEWFKRTWNTMYAVDLTRTPYWSDYQTNEQYFGLLSFDPGRENSVCYVDGDISEWSDAAPVCQNGDMSVSMQYDEKFLYFLIHKDNLKFEEETLYLPIDTTPKTGSSYCRNFGLKFDRGADFIVVLNGPDNSRVMVQERYESLRSTYSQEIDGFDTYLADNIPDADSPDFVTIKMALEIYNIPEEAQAEWNLDFGEATFETGRLKYGNANPQSAQFDSLADFIANGDYIELRLPWQLLNFADPSKMSIHDDYFSGNYGVEYLTIDKMYVGVMTADSAGRCALSAFPLDGWGNKVTWHERLKSSYYVMQQLWSRAAEP